MDEVEVINVREARDIIKSAAVIAHHDCFCDLGKSMHNKVIVIR